MSGPETDASGGLAPRYPAYARQKCFAGYSEGAPWAADVLAACEQVLGRPEFDLELDSARQHFDPDVPLRQKALELIANARYGIYDLSCWRKDERSPWQLPRNVLIELGLAIALNRPALLLRHRSNHALELPECLRGVDILEFSGQKTLKDELARRLPQWIDTPPEQDWWSRFCHFGARVCKYREAHPRAQRWGRQAIHCHISDGPDLDRDDFRDVVEGVLERYEDVAFGYLDALPPREGYQFLLCSHCQAARSAPFAIYRISPKTPAATFITIGISIALEQQFGYNLPKILLTEHVRDVPSLLAGYEVIEARSDKRLRYYLSIFVPEVLQKVREITWKPSLLPYYSLDLTPDENQKEIMPGTGNLIVPIFPDEGWFIGRAENEQEVEGLVSSFIDIGHFKTVFGNPRRPESVILFAEHGCGNTSHCLQVARRAIEDQHPALAVMFDFSRLLQGQIALDIYLDIIAQQVIVALDAQLRKEPERAEPLRRDAELAARFCAIHEQHHVPQHIANHPAAQVEEAKERYRLLGFRQRLEFLHRIIGGLGFASVYVLIDGVDEWPQTSDPQMAVSYLRPLLDSPQMLNGTGFAFKFFLPSRLRAYIHAGWPFIEVVELIWGDQQLRQMLSERLKAAWRGSQTAPSVMSFAELCQADFDVDELLVRTARGSPRRLMQLTRRILQIHSRTASEAEPLISAATIQRVVGELSSQAHT